MVKRTAQHLRDHLSVFEPEYPIQKGYVARLLKNDRRSTSDVVAEVQGIVQNASPDKQITEASLRRNVYDFKKFLHKKHNLSRDWPKLIELFLQKFPITFRSSPVVPAFSQPGHTRPAKHPEHLSVFEPGCPIQNGNISRLLNDNHAVSNVISESRTVVRTAEPNRHLHKRSLTAPSIQPYPISLKKLYVTPPSSQPECTSVPSPSRHPEPTPTSEMLLQPDIPITSTLMQPLCNSTINSSFFSAPCKLPSPRKLKKDCANRVTKQCAIMNMLQKNKRLHQQLREFKMLFMEENGNFSMTRFNENIKIHTQSATQWKTKYYTLMKACRVRSTQKLFQLVHKLEQKVKTLEGATITAQEKNSNMASLKVRLESMIANTDNFNANLKDENEQLKNMLEKTETANAHCKQHGHLRSILEETENDDAHMKCYRQASHSPETEVKEELPFDSRQNTDMDLSVLAEIIRLDHDYNGQLEVKQKAAYVKDVEILSTESMDGDTCSTQDVRSGGDKNKQTHLQSDLPLVLQSDQPPVLQFYRCDFCNRGFRHLSSLQEHRFVHTKERPFKCSLCDFRCRLFKSLKSHTVLMHPGKNLYKTTQCNLCGSVFNDRQCLQHHMLKHAGEHRYKCDVCGRQFKYNYVLQHHMRMIHTDVKPYKCHVCDFECRLKKSLDLHMLRHPGEKLFECDVSDLTFILSQALKSHTKVHTVKPCKCDVCGLECLHNTDMKKHKKLHSKEKNYVCDVCGHRYKRMSSLKSHIRTHTGEKPYQCDVCDKSFSQNSYLKSHKRVHTGERPYKCDVCGFASTNSSGLNAHKIIHTGEKPYMCDICGFQVNRKGNLRLHKKIHRT